MRLIQSISAEAVVALCRILRFLVDSAFCIREMEELVDRIQVLEVRFDQREEAECWLDSAH